MAIIRMPALKAVKFIKRLFIFVTSKCRNILFLRQQLKSFHQYHPNHYFPNHYFHWNCLKSSPEKMFLIISSSTNIPSGQGRDLAHFKDLDQDPPLPFGVLHSVDFDDLDLEDVGSGNGNDNGNGNEIFYLL